MNSSSPKVIPSVVDTYANVVDHAREKSGDEVYSFSAETKRSGAAAEPAKLQRFVTHRSILPPLSQEVSTNMHAQTDAHAVSFRLRPKPVATEVGKRPERRFCMRKARYLESNAVDVDNNDGNGRMQMASPTHSFLDRVVYRIDLIITSRKGQTLLLAVVGILLMIFAGCVLAIAEEEHFQEALWQSWTFLADPGSHTSLVREGIRIIGCITTIIGILYFSVIMGFVVDGIREKMDTLKKGKSRVAEDGHTLMLGWTDKSVSFIRQICLANESEGGGTIVVLADLEKEDLESELASHLKTEDLRGTKVIFRTGTSLLSVDLLKVAAHRAKSIVIMAQTSGEADRSDAAVLRTVLSLKTLPKLCGHIVAELRDIDNEPLVHLVGGGEVEILVSHDVIGRLVLMSARSPGLAGVFTSLLGFEGCEFYLKEWPECVGATFGDLTERFPDAIPLGIKTVKGEVFIHPDIDTVVQEGDQIIVLAEDDDTYKACPPLPIRTGYLPDAQPKSVTTERILMCGWRRDIRDMIWLLDSLVVRGTELHMLCEEPIHLRNKLLQESGLILRDIKNIRIIHHYANTAIRRHLEHVPLNNYTSMMILADQSRETDIMHSDSHSLASLLLIRDLQQKLYEKRSSQKQADDTSCPAAACKCISEILDPRTQKTISTSSTILELSEFIQSNELVSCILAMIAESRDVKVILNELLGPLGSFFAVESPSRYCMEKEEVSFWQLSKRAMLYGEILCGYQYRSATDQTVLNPSKKAMPRTWEKIDLILLRSKSNMPVIHPIGSGFNVPTDGFEQTSKSRLGKASITRQHMLEAIVQEHEISKVKGVSCDQEHQERIHRALATYNEILKAHDGSDRKTVQGTELPESETIPRLLQVTKILIEVIESGACDTARIDGESENERAMDAHSGKMTS